MDVTSQGKKFLQKTSKTGTRSGQVTKRIVKQVVDLKKKPRQSKPWGNSKKDTKSIKRTKSFKDLSKTLIEKKNSAPEVTDEKKNKKTLQIFQNLVQKQLDNQTKPKKAVSSEDKKPDFGIIDVVFCVDTTCSMSSYLSQTKETVKQISSNIINKVGYEGIDVQFGFVCYQDHPPQSSKYVTKVQDLCGEGEIRAFIDEQDVYGGGDGPEAVLDGLWDAVNSINWRKFNDVPTLRYIFHIGDAPPHGKELYGGNSYDWNSGCPCKLTAEKIGQKMNQEQIHYRLIKCNSYNLEKMGEVFKKHFFNYEECSLGGASELNVRVCDMIIREAFPDDYEGLK